MFMLSHKPNYFRRLLLALLVHSLRLLDKTAALFTGANVAIFLNPLILQYLFHTGHDILLIGYLNAQ
jgi:hypothetical protein